MFPSHSLNTTVSIIVVFLSTALNVSAQSPGLIVKTATGAGQAILDPNGDGFTSKTANGFGWSDSDTSQTEVKFRVMKPLSYEPIGDLMRGPSGGFSDIVTATDSTSCFVTSDGTRLIFRMRIGNFIPGSKSYSVLVDTDGRIGYAGASADPGYSAPGNGKIGNPGFEYEICFQSNFRVAVYNTDTLGKVVLKHANTPVTDFSQVSVARSYVSGNADYFMDFYVPFSQLGINASTPLRFAFTTVMSPLPALNGPISDIWGFGSSSDPMDAWTKVISYQTPTTAGAQTPITVCTAPPTVNAPAVGSAAISGSWTRVDAAKPSTAKILLYRDGVLIDSLTATSGGGWTIPVATVASGVSFYARAKAAGEGDCFQSATVSAIKCTGPVSARPVVTCQNNKGLDGIFPVSGTRIRVYQSVVPGNAGVAAFSLYADSTTPPSGWNPSPAPFVLHSNATKAWKCDGTDGNGQPGTISNSACGGGNTVDMPLNTTLAITAQEPGKCESMPLFVCPNGTATAAPTITSANLYPGSAIAGTTSANSYVRLYVDSVLRGATYADGSGAYTFSSPGLETGNRVEVLAQSSATSCVSTATARTVRCLTQPPAITADNSGLVGLGATSLSGTSTEANGTTVSLYKKAGAVVSYVGQTTVSNGAWNVSPIPATTANELYLATQTNSCGLASDSSNTVSVPSAATTSCATLAASSYAANASSITGTISPALTNGKMYLYIDGAMADSATGVSGSFNIPVNTTAFNKLYSGSTVALTSRTAGGAEKLDCTGGCTAGVTCSALPSPGFVLSPSSIYVNDTTVGSVSNGASDMLYTLVASPDNGTSYGRSIMSSGSNISLPSYTFSTAGSYPVAVQVVNLAEGSTCASMTSPAMLSVTTAPLALGLVQFSGRAEASANRLQWQTENEKGPQAYGLERSSDGAVFSQLAIVRGNGTGRYSFLDNAPPMGTSFYRLRMAAAGGDVAYSSVVPISRGASISSSLSASPVPVISSLTLINSDANRNGQQAVVLDVYGRVVHRFALQSTQVLDARAWPAGAYLVRLPDGESVRVVKQ